MFHSSSTTEMALVSIFCRSRASARDPLAKTTRTARSMACEVSCKISRTSSVVRCKIPTKWARVAGWQVVLGTKKTLCPLKTSSWLPCFHSQYPWPLRSADISGPSSLDPRICTSCSDRKGLMRCQSSAADEESSDLQARCNQASDSWP